MTCFFCAFLAGEESDHNRLDDVVLRTPRTTAFVSPRTWPDNAGNVIVVPNEHVRDLESCPDDLVGELFVAAKRVAAAMREAYGCAGTSLREHNGRAAAQEVDHLHVHVLPRSLDDRLYRRNDEQRFAPPEERAQYAERLKRCLTP
jgi:histidine triad (HIT) family protein